MLDDADSGGEEVRAADDWNLPDRNGTTVKKMAADANLQLVSCMNSARTPAMRTISYRFQPHNYRRWQV